jgi:hypothetical protein
MTLWQKVWREGVEPSLSDEGLLALRRALVRDDERLRQGSTTEPPPLASLHGRPCEGACAIGYCGWRGDGLRTVGEVEEQFARICREANSRLGEPASVRWFLNWFDDTPREEMRRGLLAEVRRALRRRGLGRPWRLAA